MKRHLFFPSLALALCGHLTFVSQSHADKPSTGEPIVVGMSNSMLADVPEPMIGVFQVSFASMLKEFTGLKGQLDVDGDAARMAQKIEDKKLHMAVFQGVELAWLRARHPKLTPLMILVSDDDEKYLQAQLLVRKGSNIQKCADLQNKNVGFPARSREHCRLYLDRCCTEAGGADPKSFFKKVVISPSSEQALDDLVDGKLDGVLLCKTFVDHYKHLKSGHFNKLQVLKHSRPFPPAVVVYLPETTSGAMLTRFRAGMLKMNKTERGREILGMWNVTAFELVPADYLQTMDAILKQYPTPPTALSLR